MPDGFASTLANIKQRASPTAELLGDGRTILRPLAHAGSGARFIDRLSAEIHDTARWSLT
jgi:hypothetical protein